ncbi:putative hydroxypyruvate isomerase isoform X1 [Clytia hemisphaerica]|eukprot:TCONS_00053918-protein
MAAPGYISKSVFSPNLPLRFSANLSFLFSQIEDPGQRYNLAKQAGFTSVEWGNDIYQYPIHDLVEINKDNHFEHVLINMFTGKTKGLACVPGRSEEFKQCLELSIEYCKNLKCKRLHILAGQYSEDTDITQETKKTYHDTFINNVTFASERLALENMTILLEPISTIDRYFMESADQAVDIIKELKCQNVKLQLDLFHQQRTRGSLTETITKYLDHIGHIQISQVPDRSEPDDHGEINYKHIFKLLQKLQYQHWIGCEYTPILEVNGFDWMKPYAALPEQGGYTELQEKLQNATLS